MRDLFLIGVHESGEYVVLGSNETGDEYRLPLDDAFREAARWETGFDTGHKETPNLRPAEVQALIRAGASAAEAAERAGWSVEKVRRFEGPVLAERGHIAELAGHAHVRGHSFGQGVELRRLVEERLAEHDIDPSLPRWDSRRGEDGQWIVEVRYPAEHQAHVAQWRFSRSTMTVAALNDEARAITDDEPVAAPEAGRREAPSVAPAAPVSRAGANAGTNTAGTEPGDSGDDDLVADLRERAAARIRRRGTRAAASGVTKVSAGPAIMTEPAVHADDELPFDAPPAPAADTEAAEAAEAIEGTEGMRGAEDTDDTNAPEIAEAIEVDEVTDADEVAEVADVTEGAEVAEAPATTENVDSVDTTDEAVSSDSTEAEAVTEIGHTEPALDLDLPEPVAEKAAEAQTDEPAPATDADASEPAPAAAKPAPRKRAPRANTRRASQSRTRATTGAAAEPAATPTPAAKPAATPKPTPPAQKAKPAGAPTGTGSTTGAGTRAGTGSAFTKQGAPASEKPTPPQPRPSRAKSASRGRASVPAWDDIMFGAKPGSE
ncbi:MAG: septation protein SepH [Dermatophilus congolensis]|nr:septation protein SepH [Dermatophilus congolensis]